ncbi:hypothetical protein [Pseudochrobactrum sp. HB0163]|uniref:hypothetical protein n=1 Tax=Pseudochrobactrum sp. HB0163 TaxID=3450708 RepID=UPI003F6DE19A
MRHVINKCANCLMKTAVILTGIMIEQFFNQKRDGGRANLLLDKNLPCVIPHKRIYAVSGCGIFSAILHRMVTNALLKLLEWHCCAEKKAKFCKWLNSGWLKAGKPLHKFRSLVKFCQKAHCRHLTIHSA